jgi:alanine dehydrogenase
MLVGVPKEIKDNEYRVGIVPSTVRELTENGHRVLIERQAGAAQDSEMPTIKMLGARLYPTATQYSIVPS